MSIVLITFPAAPKPIKEVVENERKFEENIERRTLGWCCTCVKCSFYNYLTFDFWRLLIKEILQDDPNVEVSRVLQILNDEVIPDQPALSVLGSK